MTSRFLICVLEVADAFADALADFGQAVGPEDQDDDHKDDEQLRKADAAHNVTSGVSCPGKAQLYHAGAAGMAFEQVASEVASMRRLMVAAAVALAGGAIPMPRRSRKGRSRSFRRRCSSSRSTPPSPTTRASSSPVCVKPTSRCTRTIGSTDIRIRRRRVSADCCPRRRSELEHGRQAARARQTGVADVSEPAEDGDRATVVAISSTADVIAPLSMDRGTQARAIAALDPWSTTALRDAISRRSIASRRSRDGRRWCCFRTATIATAAPPKPKSSPARAAANALIYPITIGKQRPPLLAELAVLTGGRSFLLKDATELEKTLSTIARELRYQYLLGYAPSEPIQKACTSGGRYG